MLLGGGGLLLVAPTLLYRKFCRAKNLPGCEENEDVPEELDTIGKLSWRYLGVMCTGLAFVTAHSTDDFADKKAVVRALEGHAALYGACGVLSASCLRADKKVCPRPLNIVDAACGIIMAGLCAAAANSGCPCEPEPALAGDAAGEDTKKKSS